ncbi:MAG: Zinc finger, DksA/TraR C4-type [Actinomycetia bacterium]|nr:Zinc finger, DksA/TraR C4-type [Actinomycetes bacterium]
MTNSSQLSDFHDALATERARLEMRIVALGEDFDDIVAATEEANTDDEHDPEGATIGFERAQITAMRDRAAAELAQLDAAAARLDAGTYGICAQCNGPIAAERLFARPTTTTCIDCAARPRR